MRILRDFLTGYIEGLVSSLMLLTSVFVFYNGVTLAMKGGAAIAPGLMLISGSTLLMAMLGVLLIDKAIEKRDGR